MLTPPDIAPTIVTNDLASKTASISGVTTLANQAVLALHASLEGTADANGLIGTVHGVTNLGETVGLGHLGTGGNLLTDAASAPGALAAGNNAPLGQLAPDAGAIGTAAEQLLGGAAYDAGANPALVSPVAAVLPVATGLTSAAPAEALANTAVLDFHQTIEAGADSSGLPGSIHGLTNLGETAGLGHLGTGGNLLSDAAGVLSGNTGSLAALPADTGNVAAAAGQLASGVAADLSSGAFLANPVGNTLAFAQALPAFPAASLANGAIDTVHATLEGAADPVAPGTIHGVTGLGNAVGLGEIGGGNALTDVAAAPTALLSGNTAPLTQLPADVGSIGTAAGAALAGAASDLSQGSLADAITHPASGSGLLAGDLPGQGILQSVGDPLAGTSGSLPLSGLPTDPAASISGVTTLANQAVLALHASLEGTADANGLIGTVHGVTNLGETVGLGHLGTGGNLLTDAASAPGALAAGNNAPLGQLAPDAGAIGTAAEQLLGGAAYDAGANPALVSPVAAVLPVATGLTSAAPAEALANTAVLDFHQTIEAGADSSGLPGSIHGLTNLGETAGLGHLGTGGNLLSDAAGVLSGNTGSLAALPADTGNVAAAAGQLASGVAADLSSGAFLANPVGNTLAFAQALPAFPAASLANGAIDTVHATLEGAADPVAPGTIHGVTGLGNAVGLGEIGGGNALTDVAAAPTALLSGNTAPLTQLPADVGSIGTAAGAALAGAASDLSQGSLADAITHPASGSGLLAGDLPGQGILQSVGDPLAGTSGSLPLSGLPTDPAASISGVTTLANQAVLALHASLEGTADANGLIGTVHGVTNLGETVGLGHLGTGGNLLTDAASAPGALAAGNNAPLGQLAPDAGAIGTAAEQLLGGAAYDAGANPALVSPVAAVLPVATGLTSAAPAEALANTAVLDFHQTIEAGADSSGLPGSIHGLTNLGETAGLGHLGTGGNLLSDAAGVLSGNTGSLAALPADTGNVAAAAGQLASGVAADLSSGAFLANPVGNTLAFAQALPAFPAASLANGAIDTVHATLEGAADPVAPGTIHGVTGLGNAVGLGEIGGGNALTDVAAAPTALLSGNTAPLTQLPADVGSIGTAAGAALAGAASDLSQGSLADAITHPASGSGLLAGDLPGQGVGGSVVSEATGALNSLGDATGTASVTQAATSTVGAATGLAGGVAHVPGDAVAGASGGAAPLAGEAGVTLSSAGTIVAAAADTAAHDGAGSVLGSAAAPVASIASEASSPASSVASVATAGVESVTHDVASAATSLASAAAADATTAASTAASGVVDTGTATTHDVTTSAGTIAPAAVADLGGTAADLATTISGAVDTGAHAVASAPADVVATATDTGATAAHAATTTIDNAATPAAALTGTAASDLGASATTVTDAATHAAAAPAEAAASVTTAAAEGSGTVAAIADTASAATHDVVATASSLASAPAAAATIASAPSDAVSHAVTGATSALPAVTSPTAASGSHDAASVAVGPQTATGGTSVEVLSSGSGGTHLVTTGAGTATAPTPTVAAVSVLPDTLHFPAATGGGSDVLTGALSSAATHAPAAPDALAHTGVDLTAVHVDVPVAAAHADPLASLAHAVHA